MTLKISDRTFFIGSGKGGVGKSTVSVNLAVALAQQGLSVGLLDADVYGPSIPIMMGLRQLGPRVLQNADGTERIVPLTKFGVQTVSIGFFVDEARSVVWRGPMLHTVLQKFIAGIEWGKLDVLLIDLPPGTGDVPISLSQMMHVDGAFVVCTPQDVAVLDAIKAINAFDQLDIPLLGIIENMAGFTLPGTNETYHIFGEGKARELADRLSVPLLASIPLITEIRRGGDEGFPAACHRGANDAGVYYQSLAREVIQILNGAQVAP